MTDTEKLEILITTIRQVSERMRQFTDVNDFADTLDHALWTIGEFPAVPQTVVWISPHQRQETQILEEYQIAARARYEHMIACVGGIDPLKERLEDALISASPRGNYASGVGMGW